MSEERFAFNVNKYQFEKDGKYFAHLDVVDSHKVVDKLNEQQATISQLRGKNEQLQKENTFLIKQRNYWKSKFNEGTETFESNLAEENEKLKEENEQLKEEIEILKQKEKVLNKIWRSYLEKGDITDSTCIRFVGDDDD